MSLLRKLFCSITASSRRAGGGGEGGGQSQQTDSGTDTDEKQKKKKKKQKQQQSSKTNKTGGKKAAGKSPRGTEEEEAEEEEEEAECAVCQDALREACTLPCGNRHAFCLACLQGVATHSPHRAHFPCPLCRKRVRIPFGGVAAFRDTKTLGQKLRAKFPALPARTRNPRRNHQRRGSRSGFRSSDFVTVSFPVLGYSEELQLDLLSTLYAHHREGQPVARDRLVEALLEEIGGPRAELPGPGSSLWVSHDLDYSDSDREEEEEEEEEEAGVVRRLSSGVPVVGTPAASRLPSAEGPAPGADPEDLDMSVVLQIIADMEENERRRETRRDAPQQRSVAAGGCSQSHHPRTNAATTPPRVCAPPSTDRSRRPGSPGPSQRPEGAESGPGTAKRAEPSTQACSAVPRRAPAGNAVAEGSPISSAVPLRPDPSHTAAARQPGINQPASQSPKVRQTASVRPAACSLATAERRSTETALLHCPQPLEGSSQDFVTGPTASEGSAVSRGACSDAAASPAWRESNATVTETPSSAQAQASERAATQTAAATQPSPRQASSDEGLRNPSHLSTGPKTVPQGKDLDLKDFGFKPRPRMGSFKLAIAAGQRSPTPREEESPPMFSTAHRQCHASPDRDVGRDDLHAPAQKDLLWRAAGNTKTEIQERPVKFVVHQGRTRDSDPFAIIEENIQDQLLKIMDWPGRDNEQESAPGTGSARGRIHVREEEQKTRKTPTTAQDSAIRSNCDMFQQRDLRSKADLAASRPSNSSERILTAPQPEQPPQAAQARDGAGDQDEEESSSFPLTLADGLQPKHRRLLENSSTPGWKTRAPEDVQEKARHSGTSGRKFQEPPNQTASCWKDSDDAEWTRRIRGLQRRVISQTRSREGHGMGVGQGPVLSPSTCSQACSGPFSDEQDGVDAQNKDAIEV